MKIRFYNGRILAMDGDMEVRRGEVWVQGNRIVYVGEDGVQEGGKAGSQAVSALWNTSTVPYGS